MKRDSLSAYKFLSPALLFFLVFFLLPIGISLIASWKRWNMITPLGNAAWVGIENYLRLFKDRLFLASLKNTLIFSIGTTFGSAALGLLLAVLLADLKRAAVWRFIFFTPVFTPPVAIGVVWRYLYHPRSGLVNALLGRLQLPTPAWLTDPATALFAVIITAIWATFGLNVIIFTAAIKGIPDMFYDAAKIDGANAWQRFIHITFPLLKPAILFVLVTSMIWAWNAFDLIYVMAAGRGTTGIGGGAAPLESVIVASLYVYQTAFRDLRAGQACAASFLLFLVMFIFTAFAICIFKKGGIESY